MSAAELPERGEIGFYVQRVWPWAGTVARVSVAVGLVMALVAAWLVHEELAQSDETKVAAVVAIAATVAGVVSGKVAKEFAERVAKVLAAVVSIGAFFYAAGVVRGGLEDSQFIAVVLMGVALQLVMYGGASLTFQSAIEEADGSLRSWKQAADHPNRPTLKTRAVGLWELLAGPLFLTTFKGIFSFDLADPALFVLWFAALYGLLFVTAGIYLAVPRWILTPMVTKAEAMRHLDRHRVVEARALPLRAAWKRPGSWRRASLPRKGPYRFSAFRRVCRRLNVPEPRDEFQLAGDDRR